MKPTRKRKAFAVMLRIPSPILAARGSDVWLPRFRERASAAHSTSHRRPYVEVLPSRASWSPSTASPHRVQPHHWEGRGGSRRSDLRRGGAGGGRDCPPPTLVPLSPWPPSAAGSRESKRRSETVLDLRRSSATIADLEWAPRRRGRSGEKARWRARFDRFHGSPASPSPSTVSSPPRPPWTTSAPSDPPLHLLAPSRSRLSHAACTGSAPWWCGRRPMQGVQANPTRRARKL